jgi:hypothetical protein
MDKFNSHPVDFVRISVHQTQNNLHGYTDHHITEENLQIVLFQV